MKKNIIQIFKIYLRHEIDIDFKACTYFFCTTFFYSMVQLWRGIYSVRLLTLAEILAANYLICYVQTYLFHDFDEADRLGGNEIGGITVCTGLYLAVSLLFDWFSRSLVITTLYGLFVALCYICVILCYIVKRRLDTKNLNCMLEAYKKREEN